MKSKTLTTAAIALPLLCHAGEWTDEIKQEKEPKEKKPECWMDFIESLDTPYDNDDNPWLQKVKLNARLHYQAARLEGTDVDGNDFGRTFDEYRRFRLGAEVDFLKFFTMEVGAEMVDDRRFRNEANDTGFAYSELADAYVSIDLENAFGIDFLDDLDLSYGRRKFGVGYEKHQSSNDIITVERSALSDIISGRESRSTGVMLSGELDDWTLLLGYFSHDYSRELAEWSSGRFGYASLAYEPGDWTFLADFVLSDPDPDQFDNALGYSWVGSLSSVYDGDRFGFLVNGAVGDKGGAADGVPDPERQGEFYGVVAMPWVWLVEDKVQLVGRAQYLRSNHTEGLQLSPRYLRQVENDGIHDVNNGRGDEHFSFYGGLNYHPWEGETKLMGGIQYEELSTPDGDADAWSFLFAVRTSF